MRLRKLAVSLICLLLALSMSGCLCSEVRVIQEGEARAAIYVAPEIMQAEDKELAKRGERLRASVEDLAHYLKKMSGAEIEILTRHPASGDGNIPILIGDLAAGRFGPVKTRAPADQGFRVVVTSEAIGLMGESDLGTSYAIYEVLDQLGCRWYMPSDMGEVIPEMKTVSLRDQDLDSAPYTLFRSIWYADEDYRRRNRMGGLGLSASHALEGYITKEQLDAHPEWKAIGADGTHHGRRLKWSAPGVAEAVADRIIKNLGPTPRAASVSLSPDDGLGFDTTDDRRLDAGDWDPVFGDYSVTDRLIWFCNRIAERVTEEHPEVMFGLLAYVNYTRPPLREKVHPNIVPQVAPITYSRAHPMTDDGEPNNKEFRYLVEGWGKAADKVSYYFYGWFLAEPSAPNPFITKWAVNIPIVYEKGNCKFWQPETFPNFESTLHGLYMGIRMAWDPTQDPKAIIDELHEEFYGHAAKEMAEYWHFIDSVWVNTPEYSGCGYGYLRRWTPERMAKARRLMDRALRAAVTPEEKFRIKMADESLQLFEMFMKLRRDLAEGRFENLATDAKAYRGRAKSLSYKYESQYAFGKMPWTGGDTVYGRYFGSFYQRTYDDASRIAGEYLTLTDPPLRTWRYRADEKKTGEAAGWSRPDFDDSDWKATDTCVETWSTLGYHNYMGAMWYRTRVKLPQIPAGRKVFLWIGATDRMAKVFVNGEHVSYVDSGGTSHDQFSGYASPASFDITDAVRPDGQNQISILCVRTGFNEIGTGGLLSTPVAIYRERD